MGVFFHRVMERLGCGGRNVLARAMLVKQAAPSEPSLNVCFSIRDPNEIIKQLHYFIGSRDKGGNLVWTVRALHNS